MTNATFVKIPGKDFEMCATQVTQAQWQYIMGDNPSYFKDLKNPVERVSWNDCQEFIKKLNAKLKKKYIYRLPTDEEWIYCCNANGPIEISEKKILEEAWFFENSDQKTHAVGEKKPNAFGLYDMRGNVWEWTATETTDYSGSNRVVRGGGWINFARNVRSASRFGFAPGFRNFDLGFRLVRTSTQPSSPLTLESAKRDAILRLTSEILVRAKQIEELLR
jgi:formylglycine-generating enzyme required for sulfatase activity